MSIKYSVGDWSKGAKNQRADVKIVQQLLQKVAKIKKNQALHPGIDDGRIAKNAKESATVKAILTYQKGFMQNPDGVVSPSKPGRKRTIDRLIADSGKLKPAQTKIDDNKVPWMKTALKEVGQAEVSGKKANPRILEYFKASKFWGTDDSGSKNAWCASFVAWVMKENGYTAVENAFRAKAWTSFGKKISVPVYGAIGIKSRRGGGHVAFVMGQSSDGKYLFMLGGNQGDMVQVKKYPLSVWNTFVVPANFNSDDIGLPVYSKPAANAGRED